MNNVSLMPKFIMFYKFKSRRHAFISQHTFGIRLQKKIFVRDDDDLLFKYCAPF